MLTRLLRQIVRGGDSMDVSFNFDIDVAFFTALLIASVKYIIALIKDKQSNKK